MKRLIELPFALLCVAALAPAQPAAAARAHVGCVTTGLYVMHPGSAPPSAWDRAAPLTVPFPGRWGAGTLRLTAYTGCGGEKTVGQFTAVRAYGPLVAHGRSAGGDEPGMPLSGDAVRVITGTIVQDRSTDDPTRVTVGGTIVVGVSGCLRCTPANDSVLRRVPFSATPGRLVWSARNAQQLTLTFGLRVRLDGKSPIYSVRISGTRPAPLIDG